MGKDVLIKYDAGLIKRVNNAITVTNKLLALSETQLIPYRKGDKWGFCTPDKKIVINCEYDFVETFLNGKASVGKDGKEFFINKAGYIVADFGTNV